jgi:hypothetical protein
MRRRLTIFFLLFLNLTVFGQHEIGLKLNFGLSKISKESNIDDPTNAILNIKSALSGQGGVFYNLHLGNNLVFGSELLFIQIEGRDRLELDYTDVSLENIGHGTSDLYEHISYFGLPIYCGLTIKNISVTAGFQLSYAFASSGRETYNSNINGVIYSGEKVTDNLPIDKFDFGPRIGIMYNLNDKFAIEVVYYYGINNILENQDIENPFSHKIQQATIGLRYTIFKKDR